MIKKVNVLISGNVSDIKDANTIIEKNIEYCAEIKVLSRVETEITFNISIGRRSFD